MKRVLMFGLWLVFVALLLQLAGWIYFSIGGTKPIQGYGYPTGLFVPHADLDYAYRPGFTGRFKGSAYSNIPIAINRLGFRDQPFDAPAPGAARIAFLGDSVVFGAGVRAEDRFTECLESSDASGATSILNLGVNSYSFGHYLVLAESGFAGLEPSAVLLGLTLNDFAPMEESGPARRLQRRAAGAHKPDWIARIQERLSATYAGRFLSELRTRFRYARMNADGREAYHTKWMRSVVDAWAQPEVETQFAADLERFAALVEASRQPLGFVLFPELNDLLRPDEFSAPRQTVLRLLQEQDLRVCDPYADFARHPNPEQLFLAHDSVHYNADGHRLLCSAVQQCLDDWGFPAP